MGSENFVTKENFLNRVYCVWYTLIVCMVHNVYDVL